MTLQGEEFATDFVRAIAVANADVYRAVTHNKGVMNGIDAVVIATGMTSVRWRQPLTPMQLRKVGTRVLLKPLS